jgi:hypothetical protein
MWFDAIRDILATKNPYYMKLTQIKQYCDAEEEKLKNRWEQEVLK